MAGGGYERVNARDDTEPLSSIPHQMQDIPNSPPPSFRSRASSRSSRRRPQQDVDPALADAFGDGSDDSDEEESDDRQRLVRPNPASPASAAPPRFIHPLAPARGPPPRPVTATTNDPPRSGSSRVVGGGMQRDGVFANITARPEAGPEEKEELPPTYEQAAADAAPPYWETTILAPGLGGPDEVFIDGMPVGSFFSFVWNGMISMSFQFIGFLLTYLLHSTHAAKNGSRAGLGITLIQYGFYMKGTDSGSSGGGSDGGAAGAMMNGGGNGYAAPPDPNSHNFDPGAVGTEHGGSGSTESFSIAFLSNTDWVSYVLMVVGWFILIKAVSDYVKARRHEQLVLQSPDRGLPVPIIAEGERSETVV